MLIYRIFATFVSWMVLQARPDTAKEIEILVLRHQLVVLQRRTPRPRVSGKAACRCAEPADAWLRRSTVGTHDLPGDTCLVDVHRVDGCRARLHVALVLQQDQ